MTRTGFTLSAGLDVWGADLAAVAHAFGGELREASTLELSEIYGEFVGRPAVALRQIGDHVLAVEDNGYEGSRPEVLRRLTASGGAVSAGGHVG